MNKGFLFKTMALAHMGYLKARGITAKLSGPLNLIECGYRWQLDWTEPKSDPSALFK